MTDSGNAEQPFRRDVAPDGQPLGTLARLQIAGELFAGLGRHDLRAARSIMNLMWRHQPQVLRGVSFLRWCLGQALGDIPDAMRHVTWANTISPTPYWLAAGNPLADHPWQGRPEARLPHIADVVVIGAGFTGGAMAYHWSNKAPADRSLVVLDMGDAASGSSGRNEGVVVMGRHPHYVHSTVLPVLRRVRADLSAADRDRLAHQFADAYCSAAYRNADMIENTIRREGFHCDYHRTGWVQACEPEDQAQLDESIRFAREGGFDDWTKITPAEALRMTGMRVRAPSAFSRKAASFHPAKWVWCLLGKALRGPNVSFFSRTRASRISHADGQYIVHTDRGVIRANHVVNATESYTPRLHRQFHGKLTPVQTQAAVGRGGPENMKPHMAISGERGFWGRHEGHTLIGSDATPVPDSEAGRIQPSRFITKFLCGELLNHFGPYHLHVTHEWSGTVGFTPDEYPIVGVMDGKRQYIIAGMAGSGTGVSFNAARWTCDKILGSQGPDDYPAEYFSPTRILSPSGHRWPDLRTG